MRCRLDAHRIWLLTSLASAVLSLPASTASGQPIPAQLRQALHTSLGATESHISTIEKGGVAAYVVETGSPDDIQLAGAPRIWVTPAYFVERFRNIAEFESAGGVAATR